MKILIVDDDEGLLNAMSLNLTGRGYEVSKAGSLDEALKYKNIPFDVAIIDGLNGDWRGVYESQEISAKRKILCTGDSRIENIARREGVETYDKSRLLKLFDSLGQSYGLGEKNDSK